MRVFSVEPALAVQYAFRRHRSRSPFFPAVSDLLAYVDEWKAARLRESEQADVERMRADRDMDFERAEADRANPELKRLIEEAAERIAMSAIRAQREPVQHTAAEWQERRNRLMSQVPVVIERFSAKQSGDPA